MPKFFEEYTDAGGGNWVMKEEKAELIKDKTPLKVQSVGYGESKFGPRYVVNVELDGEERSLGFNEGSVQSRDAMLKQLQEYLKRDDAEPVTLVLVQRGQAVLLEDADANEEE
jgi:hypothetical protein